MGVGWSHLRIQNTLRGVLWHGVSGNHAVWWSPAMKGAELESWRKGVEVEEGPWTSQPSGGEMVKDDGIEMQAWRSKPHNHEKSYSSDTSWASCRATCMSSVSPVTTANLTFPTFSFKVPARAIHIYMKLLVPATARTSLLFVLTSHHAEVK